MKRDERVRSAPCLGEHFQDEVERSVSLAEGEHHDAVRSELPNIGLAMTGTDVD